MNRTAWFNRSFPAITDNGLLPSIIVRLSGTPVRLEDTIRNTPQHLLTLKPNNKWSIQEEAGHLSDMEPLWLGRVDDFLQKAESLRVADLTNQATHNANHNLAPATSILQRFRERRQQLIQLLSGLNEEQLQNTALHPRLKTPMRIIDHAYFIAEHDDHHLANIHDIIIGQRH